MSNPTSNYSFQMPTNTDLVYQLPADFEVFGQAVDTQMKTNADAATQKATLTTKGDIYAATAASTPARLGVGTNGQVLTADSSAATGLKWESPAGGGKVLQVVYGSTTTYTSTTSTTFVDTNLSATITPTSATSKVLVLVTQQSCGRETGTAGEQMRIKLLRGSTDILLISDIFAYNAGLTFPNTGNTMSSNYLDSPATTSATTYKTQFRSAGGSAVVCQNFYAAQSNNTSTIVLLEIGA